MLICSRNVLLALRRAKARCFCVLFKTSLRGLLFPKNITKSLRSVSYKSFGTDMYFHSFGEYAIPGKNRIYKTRIDELPKYLLADDLPQRVLADLHSFNWIGHVGLIANKNVRQTIKHQINFWISNFSKSKNIAWAPLVTSRRISWWLRCFFIIQSSEKNLLDNYTASIHFQSTYLYKIRWLHSDIEWIASVFSTLLLYAAMSGNDKMRELLEKEVNFALKNEMICIDEMTTVTIVSVLVDLLHIDSFIKTHSEPLNRAINGLRSVLCTVNTDAGLCMLNSLYTPTRQYVNSIIADVSGVDESLLRNDRFVRHSAFNSDLVIDSKGKFLPFEFHFANQMASIVNSINFVADECEKCLSSSLHASNIEEERGYFLFAGNSSHKYAVGDISFSRRIYMNNLGTELRGEDVISGLIKGTAVVEVIISDRVVVSYFTYQNGLNIEFAGGKKWIMLLSPNITLTSTKEKGRIINGSEVEATVIRLDAYKSNDQDCVCKWSLKEV